MYTCAVYVIKFSLSKVSSSATPYLVCRMTRKVTVQGTYSQLYVMQTCARIPRRFIVNLRLHFGGVEEGVGCPLFISTNGGNSHCRCKGNLNPRCNAILYFDGVSANSDMGGGSTLLRSGSNAWGKKESSKKMGNTVSDNTLMSTRVGLSIERKSWRCVE